MNADLIDCFVHEQAYAQQLRMLDILRPNSGRTSFTMTGAFAVAPVAVLRFRFVCGYAIYTDPCAFVGQNWIPATRLH